MAQASVETLPASWRVELGRALGEGDERIVRQAVAALRARSETGLNEVLLRVGMDGQRSPEVRLAALGAAATSLGHPETTVFDYLESQLDPNLPALTRLAAASAFSHLKLDDPQLEKLAGAVRSAEAVEIPYLLAAFERSRNPLVGKGLVAALGESPGLEGLSPDDAGRALKEYPAEVQEAAAPLLERLQRNFINQKARLEELEPVLTGGNKALGRTIFFGAKAGCAGCHAVGSTGGRIGPDLSKIGNIRTPRDLLESIVFPSASIVRGYEPFTVTTRSGLVYSGTLGRDTADAVTLIATDRSEVRIPRSSVKEIQPSRLSIMPQGLDAQLSRQELSDLTAYLASLK
jgi:putative heme-binding domain-containing protein